VSSAETVTFAGSSADLVLSSYQTFSGKIGGMASATQRVDLAGFAYSSGATVSFVEAPSNTGGTLTLSNGSQVATLTLLGAYVTSNFKLTNDGHGGTYVADPPAASTAPGLARFVQAMAVFGGVTALPDPGVFHGAHSHGVLNAPALLPTAATSAAR
jgi:hypothetical protein